MSDSSDSDSDSNNEILLSKYIKKPVYEESVSTVKSKLKLKRLTPGEKISKIILVEQKTTIRPIEDIRDNWSIYKIAKYCPPSGWEKPFINAKDELKDVSAIIDRCKRTIYPEKQDIFNCFYLTRPENVRVVIIGQDPYHTPNTAMGLSFSVRKGKDIPPSLRNIYTEMSSDLGKSFIIPKHGDLTRWAVEEGVLLLNTSLTVIAKTPDSHKNIWTGFIRKCLAYLCKKSPHAVFLLWGRRAQEVKEFISSKMKVFESSHPSPFSARNGFIGCKHFSQCNEYLIKHDIEPIDWNVSEKLPEESSDSDSISDDESEDGDSSESD